MEVITAHLMDSCKECAKLSLRMCSMMCCGWNLGQKQKFSKMQLGESAHPMESCKECAKMSFHMCAMLCCRWKLRQMLNVHPIEDSKECAVLSFTCHDVLWVEPQTRAKV